MLKWTIASLFFLSSLTLNAQTKNDSCALEISLLTCAPGADLYSLFGHTAIRVRDRQRGMDVVFNYGYFDDNDPLFYFHFTNGIMVYSLEAQTFGDFMTEYEYDHRGVIAQVLDLTCEQKINLYEALRQNASDKNRFYNYQFYADNCTTRAGKMIAANSPSLQLENILPNPSPTYRQMIHIYLDKQQQYWPELGIDLLLGSNLDKKPGNEQAIYFLPDYLMSGFDHAHTSNGPLVLRKETLLQFSKPISGSAWFTPGIVFGFLFVMSILISLIGRASTQKALLIFDVVLFSLLGLIGLVMLYVWLFRIDEVCRNNINILWALPTHLVAVFFLARNPGWLKYYFMITAILGAILLLGFRWWPQQLNAALAPMLMIIVFRSSHLFLKLNHVKDHQPPGKNPRL